MRISMSLWIRRIATTAVLNFAVLPHGSQGGSIWRSHRFSFSTKTQRLENSASSSCTLKRIHLCLMKMEKKRLEFQLWMLSAAHNTLLILRLKLRNEKEQWSLQIKLQLGRQTMQSHRLIHQQLRTTIVKDKGVEGTVGEVLDSLKTQRRGPSKLGVVAWKHWTKKETYNRRMLSKGASIDAVLVWSIQRLRSSSIILSWFWSELLQ